MNKEELFVKMALSAWETQTARAGELINSLSDGQLSKEIAPGKNTGTYLTGHLIAVHDSMNDILGLGKRQHASLDEAFLKNPDKSGLPMPSVAELRQYWKQVHTDLNNAFKKMQAADWLKRHNSMTDADFEKDPSRNKLNVLINRTNHAAYHLGQLALLK